MRRTRAAAVDHEGHVGAAGRRVRVAVAGVTLVCGIAAGVADPAGVPAGAATRSVRSVQAVQARPADAGLAQSWTSGASAWAVVALGHLGRRLDTFWQILVRPGGAPRWSIVTPPGVASNGGFSAEGTPGGSSGPGVVTAGFQPSQYLTYSPIASTDDGGKTWTAGTLASGLLPVADAVAAEPDGAVLALVRAGGGALLRSTGSLTAWRTLISRRALDATRAGRACGILALSAVSAPSEAPPGAPSEAPAASSAELGAACGVRGVVGLFHLSASGWVATRVRVPSGARSTFTVLRLEAGTAGTWALAEGRGLRVASLVALWRAGPAASWRASPQVRLHGSVLSTAALGGRSLLVATGSGSRTQDLLWTGGPATRWRSLGPPPAGAQVIVPAPGPASSSAPAGAPVPAAGPGPLSALVVAGSEVTVWQRARTGRWGPTAQRLHVPVEYGSST